MKPFLLMCIFLIAMSCKNDNEICCVVISLGADISLTNNAGDDLLNPESPNSFKKNSIKVYHLINGEEKRAGNDDLIYEDANGIFRYRTFVNYEGNDEYPITYIDWSETDRGTIKSEISKNGSNIIAIKFWYNGELVWDAENEHAPEFTVIK